MKISITRFFNFNTRNQTIIAILKLYHVHKSKQSPTAVFSVDKFEAGSSDNR